MELIDFYQLDQRHGPYSLPVLVELKSPKQREWCFTNNKEDITWGGKKYISVPMSYKPPGSKDGVPSGGTLEIDIDIQRDEGDELLVWFDEADDKAEVEIVAIINKDGTISEIGHLLHKHGTVSWDGKKIVWNIGWDNRLQMQINPWNFDSDNLIG
jgi:hypothetical protein